MIRFGPSGIPLSCKGRTLMCAIEDVHTLGLTAMEVQLVRINVLERYVGEEEEGLSPLKLQNEIVVEIARREGDKEVVTSDLNAKLKGGDLLRILSCGFARDYAELKELGKIAKELDIQLSLHTPYYMDIAGQEIDAQRSTNAIKWSGVIADQIQAVVVANHIGPYRNVDREETFELVVSRLKNVNDWWEKYKIQVKLGFETSGRQEIFGSLDEILRLCKRIPNTIPVINFAHVHARENGSLKKKEDFQSLFRKISKFVDGKFYTHFSGVEHEKGNEIRYTPIKKGDLRFEPLAEAILEDNLDITVISGSPLLEHDAMYMKVILERVLAKKEIKEMKESRAEIAKAEKARAERAKERWVKRKPVEKKKVMKPKPKKVERKIKKAKMAKRKKGG